MSLLCVRPPGPPVPHMVECQQCPFSQRFFAHSPVCKRKVSSHSVRIPRFECLPLRPPSHEFQTPALPSALARPCCLHCSPPRPSTDASLPFTLCTHLWSSVCSTQNPRLVRLCVGQPACVAGPPAVAQILLRSRLCVPPHLSLHSPNAPPVRTLPVALSHSHSLGLCECCCPGPTKIGPQRACTPKSFGAQTCAPSDPL